MTIAQACIVIAFGVASAIMPSADAQERKLALSQALELARQSKQGDSPDTARSWLLTVPSANFDEVPWDELPAAAVAPLHVRVRYYDVLIADLEAGVLNEQIAIAYERWTSTRDDSKAPAVERLRHESTYRDLLSSRDLARLMRRKAHRMLALAIGHDQPLPAELDESATWEALAAEPSHPPVEINPGPPSPTDARTWFAARSLRDRWEQASGAALDAAKTRLEYAEAVQDFERERFAEPGSDPTHLASAMAMVADAQWKLKRNNYQAAVYRLALEALGKFPTKNE